MKKIVAASLMLFSVNAFSVPNIFTPGAINPDVTQDNIKTTICVVGWTNTVRPPTSYTNRLKTKQLAQYGYSDKKLADYEEDHLIPLSSGGHPSNEQNLWPQPYRSGLITAYNKDTLERKIHKDICSGKISLKDAQSIFMGDWVGYYLKNIKK
jgi:hypothetical protein